MREKGRGGGRGDDAAPTDRSSPQGELGEVSLLINLYKKKGRRRYRLLLGSEV